MLDISAWFNDLLAGNLIFTPTTLGYYWEGLVTTTQLVFLSLVAGLILDIPLLSVVIPIIAVIVFIYSGVQIKKILDHKDEW